VDEGVGAVLNSIMDLRPAAGVGTISILPPHSWKKDVSAKDQILNGGSENLYSHTYFTG
jgi:hypothetical protein